MSSDKATQITGAASARGDSSRYAAYLFGPRTSDVCVIVGVYNEGERIRAQLLAMQPYKEHVDIFIADGCSTDGSVVPDYVKDKVRGLLVCHDCPGKLSGQYSAALQLALDEGYTGAIMMDGNGKDGPEAIPDFVKALHDGYDFIQGSRFMPGGLHENTPIDRMLGIRMVFNPIINCAAGFRYTDAINGFKAVSRRYLLDPRLAPLHYGYDCYGLQYYLTYRPVKLGYRVTEIPVRRSYPKAQAVPTKINGLTGRIRILRELYKVLIGTYNPPAAK